MTQKIKTFNTKEFLDEYMQPDPKIQEISQKDGQNFFIFKVQDMIKFSKFPVPPTRATTHTIIFLTSGVASMKIGFQSVEIRANECLVVAAGQVFGYDKYEVNEGFICSFDNAFLLGKLGSNDLLKDFDFLNIWGNPIVKPTLKSANYIAQTFQRILEEYSENGFKNTTLIQAYFLAALCDLNLAYQSLFTETKSKMAVTITNTFKELLNKHIRTKKLLTDYAFLLNISPNHLNKTIKSVTGKSVSNWIDETILLEAKVLLFQTNNSINEIASILGFEDQSYFSRFFKKYEQTTPIEFRKMIDKS